MDEERRRHAPRRGPGQRVAEDRRGPRPRVDFAADQRAVEAAAWIYLGGTDASIGVMAMGSGGYVGIGASILGGFADAPTGFLDASRSWASRPGSTRPTASPLAATLGAPDDLVDAFGHPVPDGTVELEVGPDDLPTALRVRIEQGLVWSRTEVAFTDWNQPIDISVPSGDEVDTTPWLDEEGLRGLTGLTLVAPTGVPEGVGAIRVLG